MSNFLQDLLHLAEYARLNFMKQFGTELALSTAEREALDRLAAIDTLAVGDNAIVGPAYSTPAAAAARALVVGGRHGRIVMAPVGAADSARVLAVLQSAATLKVPVELGPGTYAFDVSWYDLTASHIGGPSDCRLHLQTGAHIVSTIAVDASGHDATLYWAPLAGTTTTVHTAITVIGGITFSLDAAVAIGSYILVDRAASTRADGEIFKVIDCTGAGPFTVTVDEPIMRTYAANDVVTRLTSHPQNIKITADPGATISGTGSRNLCIVTGENIEVEGLTVTPDSGSSSGLIMSFEMGTRNLKVAKCNLDGRGTDGLQGIGISSCKHVSLSKNTLTNLLATPGHESIALGIWGSYDVDIDNCNTRYCQAGVSCSAAPINVMQPIGCHVRGGEYSHGDYGVAFENTTIGCSVSDCRCTYNKQGIYTSASANPLLISNLDTQGCSDYGILGNGPIRIRGWSHKLGGCAFMTQGETHYIDQADIDLPAASAANTIVCISGPSNIHISNSKLANAAATTHFYFQAGGTLKRNNVTMSGAASSESLNGGATKLDASYA